MTRATSVIDDCINKLKIRGKHKENEPKREKRDTAESILVPGPATTALIIYIAYTMEWLKPPAPFLRIHDGFRKSTSPRSNISKSVNGFISQIYAYIFIKITKIKKHLRFSIKCKLIFGYTLYFHLKYSVFLDALSFFSPIPAFPSVLLYDR